MEDEPDQPLSEKTSGTFLSGLSDCSNLTFRKVQRFWESNSAAHKEVRNALAENKIRKAVLSPALQNWFFMTL